MIEISESKRTLNNVNMLKWKHNNRFKNGYKLTIFTQNLRLVRIWHKVNF